MFSPVTIQIPVLGCPDSSRTDSKSGGGGPGNDVDSAEPPPADGPARISLASVRKEQSTAPVIPPAVDLVPARRDKFGYHSGLTLLASTDTANKRVVRGANFSGFNGLSMDLSKLSFFGGNFRYFISTQSVDLNDAIFHRCDFTSAEIYLGDQKRAVFNTCILNHVTFLKSDLTQVVFFQSSLNKAVFTDCKISKTILTSADLTGAVFRDCIFEGVTKEELIQRGARVVCTTVESRRNLSFFLGASRR